MSLNFDVSQVRDYQRVTTHPTDDTRWNPITEHLVYATMTVGIREITAKNYKTFYTRLRIADMVFGPVLYVNGELRSVTIEDVKMHIGLRTNVFPDISDAEFRKRIVRAAEDRVNRSLDSREGGMALHTELEAACKGEAEKCA